MKKILIFIRVLSIVLLTGGVCEINVENTINSEMDIFFKKTLIENYGEKKNTELYKYFIGNFLNDLDNFEYVVSKTDLQKINEKLFEIENYYKFYSKIVFVENISEISNFDNGKTPEVYIQSKISNLRSDKVHRFEVYLNNDMVSQLKKLDIEKNLFNDFCEQSNASEGISIVQFLNFISQDYSYINSIENQHIFAVIIWRYLCETNEVEFLNRGGLDWD